mmetsp:Transcript_27759/g.70076  ORF Transcript_27759/g.70076 Transcript_27759/m.70076 type:complete len:220 (+) Transcript_27759:414-1073(+)
MRPAFLPFPFSIPITTQSMSKKLFTFNSVFERFFSYLLFGSRSISPSPPFCSTLFSRSEITSSVRLAALAGSSPAAAPVGEPASRLTFSFTCSCHLAYLVSFSTSFAFAIRSSNVASGLSSSIKSKTMNFIRCQSWSSPTCFFTIPTHFWNSPRARNSSPSSCSFEPAGGSPCMNHFGTPTKVLPSRERNEVPSQIARTPSSFSLTHQPETSLALGSQT